MYSRVLKFVLLICCVSSISFAEEHGAGGGGEEKPAEGQGVKAKRPKKPRKKSNPAKRTFCRGVGPSARGRT